MIGLSKFHFHSSLFEFFINHFSFCEVKDTRREIKSEKKKEEANRFAKSMGTSRKRRRRRRNEVEIHFPCTVTADPSRKRHLSNVCIHHMGKSLNNIFEACIIIRIFQSVCGRWGRMNYSMKYISFTRFVLPSFQIFKQKKGWKTSIRSPFCKSSRSRIFSMRQNEEERIYRSTVPLFINNDSKRGRGCTNRAQLLPNVTKREKEGEGGTHSANRGDLERSRDRRRLSRFKFLPIVD